MVKETVFKLLLVYILNENVFALSLPGPRVYVVTPAAPRPFQVQDAKPIPFYYRNWMRRMDSRENTTTTTTSTTTSAPKVKTPDLIFAEFESDGSMKKSIRKLLENERVIPKMSSTAQPIYVPEGESNKATRVVNYGLPLPMDTDDKIENQNNDYFSMSKNLYNKTPAPAYLSSTTQRPTTVSSTTASTTTTAVNVENIWHIIDSEKHNEEQGKWDEVILPSHEYTSDDTNDQNSDDVLKPEVEAENNDSIMKSDYDEDHIDENFALPGFATNPGSGAENESRAIRTEQNVRFPYVNLKPFQMKNLKNPMLDLLSNSKKGNKLYTSLDNFFDTKKPVRGEAQDVGTLQMNQPIDRYNPAQPYLPQQYGSKSKQSSPGLLSSKATASLSPPPPPPINGANFPSPVSYDAFPPYATDSDFGASPPFPPGPASQPVAAIPAPTPAPAPAPELLPSPPVVAPSYEDPSDSYSGPSMNSDGQSMDIGYRYKAPSPPTPPVFVPTIAPISKPFNGYSYNKPAIPSNDGSMMPMDNQEFQGYHYSKPKPTLQAPPTETYNSPPNYGSLDSSPTYGSAPMYGQSNTSPDHHDYPELVYPKDHGNMDDSNGNDFKDAGMMPPPDKPYDAAPNDHGFPSDFPMDFKFPLDFDHDHDYHHDHTTTTTTEMPRVNRFSYYYLGKKLYYLPLYFSVYFIVYVGALIIKAVLRHKIVYPNSWRPNTTTATFFSKRSVDEILSHDNMHEMTGRITHAIATAAEKYMKSKRKQN